MKKILLTLGLIALVASPASALTSRKISVQHNAYTAGAGGSSSQGAAGGTTAVAAGGTITTLPTVPAAGLTGNVSTVTIGVGYATDASGLGIGAQTNSATQSNLNVGNSSTTINGSSYSTH